ncbi:MAG: hypothetical protein R6V56_00100 [Lentisphaeria bacterium]
MEEKQIRKIVKANLNEGKSLSEVQRILADEHDVNMTYFDLRMMAADLKVKWDKQEDKKTVTEASAEKLLDEQQPQQPEGGSGTQVTVDKVTRPDALMSGTVKFKSGASGKWFIDHSHQLGLAPDSGSGEPTQDDVVEFQKELQKVVRGQ